MVINCIHKYNKSDYGMTDSSFLTRKDAARYLTSIGCPISYQTLANLAVNNNAGRGPPFTVTGWRTIYYRREDLDAWAKVRTRRVE